ncbi:MAG TPA: SRPBCC domain-containing protein [Steroidobacteraceae bacterium]|nr:SRPBCC domain-containing protein [Steroidobacteraceae bacterium]
MIRILKFVICAALFGLAPAALERASAEVFSVAGNGFEVRESAHMSAAPDKVYAALLLPAQWWSSDHTFSRNAANLVLDARAGGCWCETLPGGGSVEHLRVVWLSPGKVLRLRGAMGPFQGLAVDGVMTFTLKGAAEGTDISLTYAIGGYDKDGFDELSKAADRVFGEQLERLKKWVDGDAGARSH